MAVGQIDVPPPGPLGGQSAEREWRQPAQPRRSALTVASVRTPLGGQSSGEGLETVCTVQPSAEEGDALVSRPSGRMGRQREER